MSVLGLDVASCTGWAYIDSKQELCGEIYFPKLSGMEKLDAIEEALTKVLTAYSPQLIVIEGYGFGNTFTLVPLVEIGTIVRRACYLMGIKYYDVPPTSLKKFVTGAGNAKKDQMMLLVYKRWGFDTKSNNVADAYGLARFGMVVLGLDVPTQAQLDVVKKVKGVQLVAPPL